MCDLSVAGLRTLEELTQTFGFSEGRSREAIAAIPNKGDVQMAYNWLLDHGEEDRGGAVTLVVCDHLDARTAQLLAPASDLKYGCPCLECGNEGENWVCLFCAETHCSRYAQSHGLKHHVATKEKQESETSIASLAAGDVPPIGHFLAISLMDLSVWCYECQAYVTHSALKPRTARMEQLKFGKPQPKKAKKKDISPEEKQALPKEGEQMKGDWTHMHGFLGKEEWAPPVVVSSNFEEARPGYQSRSASEFMDTPAVLKAKVKRLAKLIRSSNNFIVYTGAGISTSSGVPDYASKNSSIISGDIKEKKNSLSALPTLSHCVLTHLFEKGHLKHWIQQNHDGLPQKAGFPQRHINEIHGAWFDPSNPVVPMTGTLRSDLIKQMVHWEEKADLCLALGTTMCGMNSDRMFVTPSKVAWRNKQSGKKGGPIGGVIINLQQTQHDSLASLRIFAKIDEAMTLLAEELGAGMEPIPYSLPETNTPHVYHDLPYNERGEYSPGSKLTLDLRPGTDLKVVRQPDWDLERKGNIVTVLGQTVDGHYQVDFKGVVRRSLGAWWIAAAAKGEVPYLPLINAKKC
mmetsp:Transcript_20175/g.27827  ORF Transcript_20175/g.27827 Transcript_20175/m.27827 type:complete len:574 (+) Transcript_20175:142-1863(+)|eukprot:CAMPEP_0201476254 /NCGR_PEP_ID=MMETSP0151_2-20130828/1490_1 /ASSEMBLY_ACC=CAM_ASM_000257 /TAXON_ID=200890 /ORGANISM="Paramoeba atlantica, Strain 621/1 / CCAP 1560/9" /LENGTH=573 /DNA_ID=CAMNT_0047856561 /DNA_START=140 /DNA_END=1861 /DNA_ORIENTATION=+